MVDGCMNPFLQAPNNNLAADNIISTISHEIIETVSNTFEAWRWLKNSGSMNYGLENGDLCSFFFGHNISALYNVQIGTRKWFTQGN